MTKQRRSAAGALPWDYNIRTLLTHRILVLSNTLGRGAVRLYASRYGIPLPEWRLMGVLAVETPSTITGLAAALSMDKGALSRTAAALAKKGYVEMRPDPTDARRTEIHLTAAGQALYARIVPAAMERQHRLVAVLKSEERAILDKILAKLQLQAEMLADGPVPPIADNTAGKPRKKRQPKQAIS